LDLEFIVQHLMLREASANPDVLHHGVADALRALGAAGVLPAEAEQELAQAAALLRHVQVLLTLLGDGPPVGGTFGESDAAALARCAGAVDFAALDGDIGAAAARVRRWYERLVEAPARRAAQRAAEDGGEDLR
jgi:glutamate-ammonia-ligase adenylyltransferase